MCWRKQFTLPQSPSSSSPINHDTRGPILLFLPLALSVCLLCHGAGAGARVDIAEPRLLDTACPVRSFADTQAEYIRYPVCLETRWVVGASSGSLGSGTITAEAEGSAAPATESLSVTSDSAAVTTATSVSGSATADTKSSEAKTDTEPSNADVEADSDSPLDNAHFLSFEEWKKLNLAKAGQSAENVGKNDRQGGPGAGGSAAAVEDRKRRAQAQGINNALDGLGEDSEIELEFGGFATENEDISAYERKAAKSSDAASSGDGRQRQHATPGTEGEAYPDATSRRGGGRRKEAGTTCKERFNYASFDCAATVLKTNPQCTGSSSVLIENKDSYMLNECRAENKFLILELCDDIQVDTVVLANYEFFSSIFRTFRVSVTDRYPAKPDMWKELGTYEAANTREVQAFAVDNPLIWARYLRIEFLTHYGNEFYCPVSLVRVHGTTMMEDYKNDGDSTRVEAEEEAVAEDVGLVGDGLPTIQENADVGSKAGEPAVANAQDTQSIEAQSAASGNVTEICQPQRAYVEQLLLGVIPTNICTVQEPSQVAKSGSSAVHQLQDEKGTDGTIATVSPVANPTSSEGVTVSDAAGQNSTDADSRPQQPAHESRVTASAGSQKVEGDTSTEIYKSPTVTQSQTQQAPPTPNPTTQESFFKSVNKRLQMLETNSSLSLLYIEEQSRILRDAFNKVEKRQLTKTSNFLENLNSTVLNELREFRQQYDHIWHSVIIDFEQQRQQYHRELYDVSAQLGILADELVFQKRIAIIQGIFVLICFGLALFSRSSVGTYLELPRVQSFVSRSQSFRSASPSYETPSASPSPEQQHRAYQDSISHHHTHHQRQHSDESHPESVSEPIIAYSGPTPPPSDIASTRSEGDEKLYQHPEGSASSTISNSLMLGPDSGLARRQRSSPPSLGRGDSADSVASADDDTGAVATLKPS